VNDSYVGRSLDAYGEWCDEELSLLFELIRPGDLVIDVGANSPRGAGRCARFGPSRLSTTRT
jgi:hypothetical protein